MTDQPVTIIRSVFPARAELHHPDGHVEQLAGPNARVVITDTRVDVWTTDGGTDNVHRTTYQRHDDQQQRDQHDHHGQPWSMPPFRTAVDNPADPTGPAAVLVALRGGCTCTRGPLRDTQRLYPQGVSLQHTATPSPAARLP